MAEVKQKLMMMIFEVDDATLAKFDDYSALAKPQ